jgi:hypothetical protein
MWVTSTRIYKHNFPPKKTSAIERQSLDSSFPNFTCIRQLLLNFHEHSRLSPEASEIQFHLHGNARFRGKNFEFQVCIRLGLSLQDETSTTVDRKE